ncbi:DUF6470 family protein [Virgibacillus sp. YIM 98842]|uniref:DUF6470 family protein n=1 Tax=Virgibacillus sp. YIM 98842 TaxID=2663533 RepID=UPI0013DB2509|nr:DUF6470 family protein [Virgibacillus sp. YIM 98842]
MNIPQIRMQSQMAQIEISQTAAKQYIRQPAAEISIQQPPASLSIQTTPSRLQIDQTQAWEDMNLMHISRLNEKFAKEGLRAVQEGMAKKAAQGRELMMIENEGAPVIEQAMTNSQDPVKQLGINFIPSPFSVKINYQPSDVEIDVQVNKPVIEVERNNPQIHYEPGSVDIRMKQFQELNIDFINLYA